MTEQREGSPETEIRPEFKAAFDFADRILTPGFEQAYPEETDDPNEVFSGPVLDLNDPSLTEQEKSFGISWIEKHLGSPLETAPVKSKYLSADEQTKVIIFDVRFGTPENPWFLSKWQNEGEEPSFILWAEDMYECQVSEAGYSETS